MTVQNDARVTIRVDRELKERAEALFSRLEMNMSTALNVFLRKAVDEQGIPFSISVPRSEATSFSLEAITSKFEDAVSEELKAKEQNRLPVARYDVATKQAYLEYSDGSKEYVS